MFHALYPLEQVHHVSIDGYRIRILIVDGHDIHHLNMITETDYLVTDGVLESTDHPYRNYHHGQSYGYTGSRYFKGRPAHLFAVAVGTIYSFSNKKREIHN